MSRQTILTTSFWVALILIYFAFAFNLLPFGTAVLIVFINLGFAAATVYLNSLWGFKKYYREKHNWPYVLFSIVLVIIMAAGLGLMDKIFIGSYIRDLRPRDKPAELVFLRSAFWISMFHLGNTILLLQNRLQDQTVRSNQIHEEKLQTELKLLKAQINPHFLFNALNNIYSLSYMKSDAAPDGILKLSQMLRYVIEDCQEEQVSLDKEVEYIENYIVFQKMKSAENSNVNFSCDGLNRGLTVSPLLFLPFVENSFKFSRIAENDDSAIDIKLSSKDNVIKFSISNSIPLTGRTMKGAGTGIENVKQRLNILYPGEHNLEILKEEDRFTVNLELLPK